MTASQQPPPFSFNARDPKDQHLADAIGYVFSKGLFDKTIHNLRAKAVRDQVIFGSSAWDDIQRAAMGNFGRTGNIDHLNFLFRDQDNDADMAKIKTPNVVRFSAQKLDAFVALHGVDKADVVKHLAHAIRRGHAPQHILDLQADQYDDAVLYAVTPDMVTTNIYLTENRALSRQHHQLEYTLGIADFITGAADNARMNTFGLHRGTLYLCLGYEYFDYEDIDRVVRHNFHTVEICAHNLVEAPNMVQAARIWWDEATGTYAMVTPWNEKFVMWFKLVDKQHKRWDHEAKIWYISPAILDEVKQQVTKMFGSCSFVGPSTGPKLAMPTPTDVYGKFMKLVGLDAMNKAYRDAAMRFHSDLGGDGSKMSELNVLWKQIKESIK